MSNGAEEEGSRPKLSLQPRGASADTTAPATSASAKPAKPSPFGAARPREQVIAEREGKNETEVLKEQAQKEWTPHIVLTEAQREEKKAAEAELAYAQNELEKETDPVKLEGLREEIGLQEKKLEDLLASFERMAVQTAQSGGTRPSQDKAPGISANAYNENPAGSRNFMNRGRGRGGERSSYGNTWGDAKGRSGQSQCYTCGEVGHFSRDCPSGGGGLGGSRGGYGGPVGGRGGGGNVCYTCGQQGHFSRECPYADNYGASQYSGQATYYDSYQGYPNTPYGGGVYGGDQAGGYNGGYGNYRGFPSGRANYSRQGDYRSQ